jgi:hypothetical protein
MKKLYSFWFGKYQDESYEIQKKMKYLFLFAVITFFVIFIGIINYIFGTIHWWQTIGDITSLLAIILILFFIKQGHPKWAVYSFTFTLTSLIWYYILQDLYSDQIRTLSRLYEMISFILVSIMLLGLYAIQRRQIIFHSIYGNLLFISHLIILSVKFNHNIHLWHLFIGLVLINASFLGSILIYNLSHNLMKLLIQVDKEKLDALTQVVDEFLPICANCKGIRQNDGSWKTIEEYITDKSKDVKFSHGLCLPCAKKLYPDFEDKPEK